MNQDEDPQQNPPDKTFDLLEELKKKETAAWEELQRSKIRYEKEQEKWGWQVGQPYKDLRGIKEADAISEKMEKDREAWVLAKGEKIAETKKIEEQKTAEASLHSGDPHHAMRSPKKDEGPTQKDKDEFYRLTHTHYNEKSRADRASMDQLRGLKEVPDFVKKENPNWDPTMSTKQWKQYEKEHQAHSEHPTDPHHTPRDHQEMRDHKTHGGVNAQQTDATKNQN